MSLVQYQLSLRSSGRQQASLARLRVRFLLLLKLPRMHPCAYVAASKWRRAIGEGDIQI